MNYGPKATTAERVADLQLMSAQAEQIEQSQRRILELELEVKRLRSSLDSAKGVFNQIGCTNKDHRHPRENCLTCWGLYGINATLSTPQPALAEAYVRLREAVKDAMPVLSRGHDVEMALADIKRLEKGE